MKEIYLLRKIVLFRYLSYLFDINRHRQTRDRALLIIWISLRFLTHKIVTSGVHVERELERLIPGPLECLPAKAERTGICTGTLSWSGF